MTVQNDSELQPHTSSELRRKFSPSSPYLAIRPEALDLSYLPVGSTRNDRTDSNVAIIKICGPLEHHAGSGWFDSYEEIAARVEAAMSGADFDSDGASDLGLGPASAVVLCIDSPGGEAAGSSACHRKLRKLRKKYNVPLFAFANEMAASAAYSIASACDEIWLPDTGTVGSIGVIATVYDRTKQNAKTGLLITLVTSGSQKADNHADRPLTEEITARMQERVNRLASVFFQTVADARGVSPENIAELEAGVFIGQHAVDVGIADRVGSWDAFMRHVSNSLVEPNGATVTQR